MLTAAELLIGLVQSPNISIKALVYLSLDISELPIGSSSLAERFRRRRNGLLNLLLVNGWTESGLTLGEGVSPTELKNSATETT